MASAIRASWDAETRLRFVGAWSTGACAAVWWHVIDFLGLGGLAALTLAYASLVQGGIALGVGANAIRGAQDDMAGVASLGGMGGLTEAVLAETEGGVRDGAKAVLGMARLLAENGPQLVLQTSLLMARGESLLGQPVLLVSVALSLVSGVKKARELTMAGMREPNWFGVVLGLLFSACVWAFLAYAVAKLYFLEVCPSREWGLTTGCVDV